MHRNNTKCKLIPTNSISKEHLSCHYHEKWNPIFFSFLDIDFEEKVAIRSIIWGLIFVFECTLNLRLFVSIACQFLNILLFVRNMKSMYDGFSFIAKSCCNYLEGTCLIVRLYKDAFRSYLFLSVLNELSIYLIARMSH